MRQLEAAQGKSTDSEGKEAELFAASLGTLKAKRGEVTGEEIVEVKSTHESLPEPSTRSVPSLPGRTNREVAP